LRSSERPISEAEWCAAADAWPGMSRHDGSHYALSYPGERSPGSLYWQKGEIVVRVWKVEADVARLAESLNAYLIGDEGERYYPDGTVRRPGEFPPDNPPGAASDELPTIAPQEPRAPSTRPNPKPSVPGRAARATPASFTPRFCLEVVRAGLWATLTGVGTID
jgi:hypothetical protein